MAQSRRPSPLQRRVLIVLAALDEKRPGPVLTRDVSASDIKGAADDFLDSQEIKHVY